jgi:hypothetical protein
LLNKERFGISNKNEQQLLQDLRYGPSATSNCLLATSAFPDTNSLSLDGAFPTECASVAGMLSDFHLLHLLTQGSTISEFSIINNGISAGVD